nr:hypothetical protein [Klebsiella michiganensis]
MVQILNTTGLNYHVEQTIANAEERIILISANSDNNCNTHGA